MVVITSGDVLAKRKDDVWKALDAQKEAIDLLQNKPADASRLIASYFIAEPTLKTLTRGELPRETVISEAISTQVFTPKLTDKDTNRLQEIADILQAQGSLKTRDGKPYDVSSIVDLSWQEARSFELLHLCNRRTQAPRRGAWRAIHPGAVAGGGLGPA